MGNMIRFLAILAVAILATSCDSGGTGNNNQRPSEGEGEGEGGMCVAEVGGQKGPCERGSDITCACVMPDGTIAQGTEVSCKTDIEGKCTMTLAPCLYSCSTTCYYFDEHRGVFSESTISMSSTVNVEAGGTAMIMINSWSNAASGRTIGLYVSGMAADAAQAQADLEARNTGSSLVVDVSGCRSSQTDLFGGDTLCNQVTFADDAVSMEIPFLEADPDSSNHDAVLQDWLNQRRLQLEANGEMSADMKARWVKAEKSVNAKIAMANLRKFAAKYDIDAVIPDINKAISTRGDGIADADRDNPEMAEVAAGTYSMGCDSTMPGNICSPVGYDAPVHSVTISQNFKIDKWEVTAADYAECVQGGGCAEPDVSSAACNYAYEERSAHPMNCATWAEAEAYCNWAGKRLPTEAEWEYAARGPENRIYPWGNQPADCGRAVMYSASGVGCGEDGTRVVGSRPNGESWVGASDMCGNVWEYVEDCWNPGFSAVPVVDPVATGSNCSQHVVKGGGYGSPNGELSGYSRMPDENGRLGEYLPGPHYYIGFRCAKSEVVEGEGEGEPTDSGTSDVSMTDEGVPTDATVSDATTQDTGPPNAGQVDVSTTDTSIPTE